jgi:hypothetical protein
MTGFNNFGRPSPPVPKTVAPSSMVNPSPVSMSATAAIAPASQPSASWERQPGESLKAFTAFQLYLGMGPQRSLAAVGAKLAKSEKLIGRWSSKYDWALRIDAHVAEMAVLERDAAEAVARFKGIHWANRQIEQRVKEWDMGTKLAEMALVACERWLKRADRCGSLEGIASISKLAMELRRAGAGMPKETVAVTGADGGPIRVEFAQALDKLFGPVVDVQATVKSEVAK